MGNGMGVFHGLFVADLILGSVSLLPGVVLTQRDSIVFMRDCCARS